MYLVHRENAPVLVLHAHRRLDGGDERRHPADATVRNERERGTAAKLRW